MNYGICGNCIKALIELDPSYAIIYSLIARRQAINLPVRLGFIDFSGAPHESMQCIIDNVSDACCYLEQNNFIVTTDHDNDIFARIMNYRIVDDYTVFCSFINEECSKATFNND